MTVLRILAICLTASALFCFLIWPDLAYRIERLQQQVERKARLKRLRENCRLAERIIEQEKAIERARFEDEMERRAHAILLAAYNDEEAKPFALDDNLELPKAS